MDEEIGNEGSRTHVYGANAKAAVERSRDRVAAVVGAKREEVVFTSGATEANNLALLGLAEFGLAGGKRHLISTTIEHKAVLEPLASLIPRRFELELVAVGPSGRVDPDLLCSRIRHDTLLVSVMHVNNETGVRQPIDDIATAMRGTDAFLHVDAAQGFGKDLEPLRNKRIDLISVSGHKIYAPRGIGALITRRRGLDRLPLQPLMYGGGQERGLRPGTLPVPLIVGFGVACDLAVREQGRRSAACQQYRQTVLSALAPLGTVQNGAEEHCVPHVLNVSFPGLDSEAVLIALKDLVAASNGSACTSHSYDPSHVLTAMGLDEQRRAGAVRLSWSHLTPGADWKAVTSRVRSLMA